MILKDDAYLQLLIESAPIGICVLDAATLQAEMLNDKFIEIAGKPREAILGKWYWEPFAEAKDYYEDALNNVAITGQPYYADEAELLLKRNGKEEQIVVTFVYAPVKDSFGQTTKIAVWVLENTQQVSARRKIDDLNKKLADANENLKTVNTRLVKATELTEAEHEKQHAELRGLFRHAPVALATFIGPKFVIGLYNEKSLQLWDRTAAQVAGLPLFEALPETAGQGYEELLNAVYITGVPFRASELPATLLRNGQLENTFIDFMLEPLRDDDQKIYGIVAVSIETTGQVNARKKAEQLNQQLISANEKLLAANNELIALTQSLMESEARFRSFAEGSEMMISINDVNGNVEYVNKAWLNLVGKTQEEMQAYSWGNFLHPDDKEALLEEFRLGIESRLPFTVEFRMLDNAGKPRWIYTNINPRLFADGTYAGTISSSIDVTKQIIARNEIKEVNSRLKIALDAGNFGTTEVDLATGNMVCNEKFKNCFGRSNDEEFTYPDMFEAMLPAYREDIRARVAEARATHSLYEATYEIQWPDGSLHWIEAHGRARYDKQGNADRMVGLIADVTEKMTARVQLERAEANLRLATETAALGTWYINAETLEFKPSGRLKELFGYNADEVMPYEAAVNQIPETHRQKVTDAVNAAINQGKTYEVEYPITGFHDKKLRWVRATGRLYAAKAGEPAHFSGVIMDISRQVTALKALQESEEKLQIAIHTGKMGTWSIDTATLKTTLSDFVREMIGIPPEVEPTIKIILKAIKPEYHEMLLDVLKNAVEKGQPSDTEYAINNLQTGEEKWVKATATVLLDGEGRPLEYTGILMDITERKMDELRKNDFIGMVSHELKTPLTSMKGYIQVLDIATKNHDDAFTAKVLGKANNQVAKMTAMINGFLNVSRLASGKIYIDAQRFNMAQLIQEAEEEVKATTYSHQVVFAPVVETWVNADHDKIGQVINNLISNAMKYSPQDTVINVACVSRDGKALVSVKDQGRGVSKQDLPKLFERYYRVQETAQLKMAGFGIGLYLCYEIIKRHGGDIWAESEPGKGSTFYFTLPTVE